MKADEFDDKFDRGDDLTGELNLTNAQPPRRGTTTHQRRLLRLDENRPRPRGPTVQAQQVVPLEWTSSGHGVTSQR